MQQAAHGRHVSEGLVQRESLDEPLRQHLRLQNLKQRVACRGHNWIYLRQPKVGIFVRSVLFDPCEDN